MDSNELKLVFASNLIHLRQSAGLTQAGLAEKVNYSDKTVSKWERGEAIPDAFVLKQLSALFSVSVDALLEADCASKKNYSCEEQISYNPLYIMLTSVAAIFTLCLLEFVLVWSVAGKFHWAVLFSALPFSLIALLTMNSIWYRGRHNSYIIGALVASLILQASLTAFQFQYNIWQLLLVIIPAEAIVFLACKIRNAGKRHRRKSGKQEAEPETSEE